MRVISLWQPWASLWLSGVKIHETRHWHIKDQWKDWKPGDRIVVHAAKRFEKEFGNDLAPILRRTFGDGWYKSLPTGALLGTIAVMGCHPAGVLHDLADDDFESGDFSDGRWAWRGADPAIFPKPIPYKGSQGIFSVPDDLVSLPAAA